MTARLHVLLLGEPLVSYTGEDSEDVPLSSRCVLLLAYLLLHRKTRSREHIAAALCPETLDCEARTNLRRTLYQLVRALPKAPEPWIIMDPKRMQWNPLAPIGCDVDDFDRLSRHEDTRAAAIDVYGGDLLTGEDAEWVVELRSRLRERQVEALKSLADTCRGRGDTSGAAGYYGRLLELEPFREDAFRSLLDVRYVHGDRARAAFEYHGFVNRLNVELGVDPMPETIACYERMINGDPSESPGASRRHSDARELVGGG